MVTDYQLHVPNRKCCATGRDLKPGERYFGVVIDEGGAFVRRDYAADAWPGPPEHAVGHWSGKVPAVGVKSRPPIDDELLLDCLRRLEGAEESSKVRFRYVVALLLMRRKRLKLDDTTAGPTCEMLTFRDPKSNDRHEVVDPGLAAAELSAVQDEVFQVLGWD